MDPDTDVMCSTAQELGAHQFITGPLGLLNFDAFPQDSPHGLSTAYQVIAVSLSALLPVPRLNPLEHIVLPPFCVCVYVRETRGERNED